MCCILLKNLHERIVRKHGKKISFASYSNYYFKVSVFTIYMLLLPSLYFWTSWHLLILLWWIRVEYLAAMLCWPSDILFLFCAFLRQNLGPCAKYAVMVLQRHTPILSFERTLDGDIRRELVAAAVIAKVLVIV